MPPKKKTSVKKKKKKGLIDAPPPIRPLYGENLEKVMLEKLVTRNDLVFIKLKQIDWAYADFTIMVHSSSPLYTICRKIEEKHGRMATDQYGQTSLQLYRHPPNEKNILPPSDWFLRLDQIGITGGTIEEQHSTILYYNYVPAHYSPLLQREPQLMIQKLSQEDQEAFNEAKNNELHDRDDLFLQQDLPSQRQPSTQRSTSTGGVGASSSSPTGMSRTPSMMSKASNAPTLESRPSIQG